MNKKVDNKKVSYPVMKSLAPVWCTDVHSTDYTRLVLKDLQLKSYLGRVLSTARQGSGGRLVKGKVVSSVSSSFKKGGKKKKGHYLDGHGSWVEVDRRFDGVQVNVAATGSPAKSMKTVVSKKLFQKSLSQCAYPSSTSSKVDGSFMPPAKGLGFRFRFCGRSLSYPMTSAACLKQGGRAYPIYKEQLPIMISLAGGVQKEEKTQLRAPSSVLSKSSMASAAANFVLRDLSLQFHRHAPSKNASMIIEKVVEGLKEDFGVWGTEVVIGSTEVRGMKGVGVLARNPSFERPLLGVRIGVSGRLNRKDMASTIWASGGKVPRSWLSPRDSGYISEPSAEGRMNKRGLLRAQSGGGLSYAAGGVATRYGTLGVKVWLFF
jgi:hypothetical protein